VAIRKPPSKQSMVSGFEPLRYVPASGCIQPHQAAAGLQDALDTFIPAKPTLVVDLGEGITVLATGYMRDLHP